MNHLDVLRRNLELYCTQCEHLILLGDFNVKSNESSMHSFFELYGCKNLIAKPSCYKNPEKLSSIDLIATAQLHSTKPELRFCAGSNPACGASEICNGEDL